MSTRRTGTPFYHPRESLSFPALESDVLLPSRHELIFARRDRLSPAQRLMLAVLESAVYDLQRYRYAKRMREKRLFHEAYEWFMSQDDAEPFSFVVVCQALRFDPDCLRAQVLLLEKGARRQDKEERWADAPPTKTKNRKT